MRSAATAFKCIWWKRAGMLHLASARLKEGSGGRKEGRRGERRLACHCIIQAAINSLCPEAEWTHHSNGPQAEWHPAALNQPPAPPHQPGRFKQAEKAWCLMGTVFDLLMKGVSWLQVTLQRAQLLFGVNIFTFSSLHPRISVDLPYRPVYSLSAVFGGASHYAVFHWAQRPDPSPWQHVHSVNPPVPVPDWTCKSMDLLCYDGARIMYDLSWWLHLLLVQGSLCECFRAFRFLWIRTRAFWMWTKCHTTTGSQALEERSCISQRRLLYHHHNVS